MANKNVIHDYNMYLNGNSCLGQVNEVTPPNLEFEKSEHSTIGSLGTTELYKKLAKMEATIKWAGPENNVLISMSNPFTALDIMVRAQKDVYINGTLSGQVPVIYYIKGTVSSRSSGTFKSGDPKEDETKISVSYYKEVINGQEIIEADIDNYILRVGGEDIMAKRRENLGI